MLESRDTNQFQRDLKLSKKRGKDLDTLRKIMELIVDEKPLPPRCKDHPLTGNWVGRRECHIEGNWLLIYKLEPGVVTFERLGTHSDLFSRY